MENVVNQNDDIKRMAAFFAEQAYSEPIINTYTLYNDETYVRIASSHGNESGFDGDVYLNTVTHKIIVTFRGTEFGLNEEGYKDALKADIVEFGSVVG